MAAEHSFDNNSRLLIWIIHTVFPILLISSNEGTNSQLCSVSHGAYDKLHTNYHKTAVQYELICTIKGASENLLNRLKYNI